MAADDTGFGTELRGYRKDEVDQAVNDLRRELIKANADKADQSKELKRLQAVAEDLQAELDEVGSPTYSGLGTRLENTLRVAEEQSTRLISQADIDAEKLRATVAAEVQQQRQDAHEYADKLVGDAQAQVEQITSGARDEAESVVSRARAEAETVTNDALREAAAIRGSVATEVAEARAAGKREIAALRAEAEREIAELKIVAQREVAEAREAAAELARDTERGRAEFDAESTRRRAELEHDLEEGRARARRVGAQIGRAHV